MNDCMLLKKGESMEKENYQFEYYAGSNFYFTNLMFILVMFGFGIVAFISIYMDIDKGIEHGLSHSTLMIIFLAAIFGGIILYLIKNIFKEKESKVPILAGKRMSSSFALMMNKLVFHGKIFKEFLIRNVPNIVLKDIEV